MKLLLWIVYGVFLAAGAWLLIARHAPQARLEAAADLPAGHRLGPGDVQLPGGEHFLRRRVRAGETFSASDLATLPYRGLPIDMIPMTFALAPGTHADVLQSGRAAWICPSLPQRQKVPVMMLICAEGDATCLAVVGVPRNLSRAASSAPRSLSESQCK